MHASRQPPTGDVHLVANHIGLVGWHMTWGPLARPEVGREKHLRWPQRFAFPTLTESATASCAPTTFTVNAEFVG